MDLAGVHPRLLTLGFRAVTCPACGRVLPLRRRSRRRAAAAALVGTALGVQVFIGVALLLVSAWFIAGAAAEAARVAPDGDLLAMLTERQKNRGRRLVTVWLQENWIVFLCHAWAGAWVCLSLSHWRRRWARIPAWLGTQSVLMTAVWIWPMLEGWWRHGSVAQPDLNTLIAMGVLVLAGIPIVAFWFPFESALLRRINSDSIVTHMMRRRSARKVALIRAHHA